ncbi:MAG: NAD(P)H-hydrate dehydratase [Gammaproteobacteria bacterium]|nr:NAD(P)H-hydrate dehydratase [Gammaproteobacteria bacterium]MBQ0839398.1 NAD(P)H-hydrate dehydratase [Gammaproteobacteria bacterium]
MIKISNRLYTAQAVRELDRRAIEEQGIAGIVLMKRAGRAALDALLARWPAPEKITVFCGGGNNGGDGYIMAGLAQQMLIPVEIVQLADAQKLKGDARRAWAFASEAGVAMRSWQSYSRSDSASNTNSDSPTETQFASGIVVDALLGTGMSGEVRGDYRQAIEHIHQLGSPVLSADIPSGLCSDTGAVLGVAVQADITVSFIGIKVGLLTGRGPALAGDVLYRDLGVPEVVYGDAVANSAAAQEPLPVAAERLQLDTLLAAFPQRERDAHKGRFGHVLVIGGDKGYGGAVAMAAEAALRVGAGLVSVATRPEHVPALLARRPELMVKGVASGQELEPHLEGPTLIVIGPGLGRSPWSEQMLQKAIGSGLPMVVDADALNILSEGRVGAGADASNWVLTPHPGEAARLLACSNGDIQADRLAACRNIAAKYSATVLLKGAGTLISGAPVKSEKEGGAVLPLWLCPYGNPGMASGGMGDVLAGIIGGLLAQGLNASMATCLGACLHSVAADRAAGEHGEKGLLASDLFVPLRHLVNAR